MQLSLTIQDELYERAINSGIDMQSKFSEYLAGVLDRKDYLSSKQFQEDKAYFQKAHEEVKNGEANMLSHDEVWNDIDKHIQDL